MRRVRRLARRKRVLPEISVSLLPFEWSCVILFIASSGIGKSTQGGGTYDVREVFCHFLTPSYNVCCQI